MGQFRTTAARVHSQRYVALVPEDLEPRLRYVKWVARRPVRSLAFALTLLASAQTRTAVANEEDSKTLFAKARELRLANKCEEAAPLFQKAFEIFPDGLGSLRNLAECQEQLGRFASARRSWWDLRRAALGTTESKYEGWAAHAESAYAKLEPKVPHLVLKVENAPPKFSVTLNGQPLDGRLLGTDLEQDVGELVIVLRDGSAVPQTRTIKLAEGQRETLTLVSTAPKESRTGREPTRSGPSPLIITGGVAFGLAGASVGGLIGGVVMRNGALDAVDAACPSYTNCDRSLQEDVDQGELGATLVNVFAATSGAFAALGVGLTVAGVLTNKGSSSKEASPIVIEPDSASGGAGLRLRGVF